MRFNGIRFFLIFSFTLVFSFTMYGQVKMPVCGPYAQFYNKDSINVTSFGASTVQGNGEMLNFQTPLKAFLERCYTGKQVQVSNYGIAGETTAMGLLRFDNAIAQKTGFLLILMGANDAIQIADNKGRVSLTLDNIRTMVNKAKEQKLDVILGTLQYFVEPAGRTPEAILMRRRNRIIDQLNTGFKNLARELGVFVADINSVIGKNKELYADIVHPNARGYRIMALVWFDALNQTINENYLSPGIVQNFPNPANGFTKLGFNLPSASRTRVTLYNMRGQKVAVVFDDFRNAGFHEEQISTELYPSGVYILYYELLNMKFSKKIIIVH